MNQSRISQLLSHSRSRHQVVHSYQLKKISNDWQSCKRRSYQSHSELRKMIRQMRYLQSLDQKLTKGVFNKSRALQQAQKVRQRHKQDLRKKHQLHQLRVQEMLKNRSVANKIKQDRLKKISAVKQSYFDRENLAHYYRQQGRKLRDMREQNYSSQYQKNRSRVEQILQFECNLRQSAIRKKENENLSHISAYREAIQKQQQRLRLNQHRTFEMKKRMKFLTQSSTRKLDQISSLNVSLDKHKTPYKLSLRNQHSIKKRSETEKNYTQTDRDTSSVYLSQYHKHD